MATYIGTMDPYDKSGDLTAYLERFEFFIEANDIKDVKKKSIFLSVVGESTFAVIKDLLQPAKVGDKTYEEIVSALKAHFEPEPSVIVQRYKFDKLIKGPQEPVADFINKIRHLSEKCKFGTSLDERLRDKLVSGLCDMKMVNRLLSEGDSLTFVRACEICLQLEQNQRDAQNLLSGESIHKMNDTRERSKGGKLETINKTSPYVTNVMKEKD